MIVRVKLFALARQLVESDTVTLDVPSDTTVGELRRSLILRLPQLAPLEDHLKFAVNQEYAGDDVQLSVDAEVACIPPVSGG